MRVVILDAEKAYAENLLHIISSKWPQIRGSAFTDSSQLSAQDNPGESCSSLLLYNDSDFPQLSAWNKSANGKLFQDIWKIRPVYQKETDSDDKIFSRLPIAGILSGIAAWLPGPDGRNTGKLENKSLTTSGRADFWLYFCLDRERCRKIIRSKIRAELKKGRRVVYLPLMPTYYMRLISIPDSGPGMSDLLLGIGSGLEIGQISRYWQPHPDGYYQFRPADRSDDLVTCEPGILRQLITNLLQHLGAGSQPSVVIADCCGIPLANARTAAVLADHCVIELSSENGFALDAAQKEINLLLAELPASCQIIKLRDEKPISAALAREGGDNVS